MINWYVNRLKTMSPAEILYRGNQYVQKGREKRNPNKFHRQQDFDKVFEEAVKNIETTSFPADLTAQFQHYKTFEFFGLSLDLENKIDWHLDLKSGKKFPLTFSKNIDIRSGEYGNAKIVWEINRLQFLLPLAVKYKITNDGKVLQLWMSVIKSWVDENPYLKGINWYSNIEVNLRLIVWYFCWQVLWSDDHSKNNEEFIKFAKDVWLPTIYDHCVHSSNNPSKFSSANNHLIAEYSGLFVASLCWQFKEAAEWRIYAQKGLETEIVKQHSGNGINKEEASEYIQFITDFFLIPLAVAEKNLIQFSETYTIYFRKICGYIWNIIDVKGGFVKYGDEDDGKVIVTDTQPHFNNFLSLLISAAVFFKEKQFKKNDSNFDFKNWLLWGEKGRNTYNSLDNNNIEPASVFYKEEGHFIFRKADTSGQPNEILLHFDAAPLGFLSIAAHGHADALSIALTLDGDPIFVDPGTYTYHTEKEWRKYFVSTIAHNTICIDLVNQAEYIGPTMWLRHYTIEVLNVSKQKEKETISAKHSGYNNIGCSHKRTIEFNREKEIFIINDQVSVDNGSHKIFQPWHLHPEVQIISKEENVLIIKAKKGRRNVKLTCDGQLNVEVVKATTNPIFAWYSNSFLQKEPANVVKATLNSSSKTKYTLSTVIEIF